MFTELLFHSPLPVLLALGVLAIGGTVATFRAIARDGYCRGEVPQSHEVDEFAAAVRRR